jgi:glycosyltransferase involved in cell wall biosynthesis
LLKDDSVEELKNWIENALENLDKKKIFAKINKKILQEKFSWDKNIGKLYEIVNE